MTTRDGSFSPQLWVQRVLDGASEQESINSHTNSPSSSFIRSPVHSYAQRYSASPGGPPSRYSTPSHASYNSSYTPPFISSPSRPGSWGSPVLPPQGFKKSWDVVLDVMREADQ